MRHNLIGLLRHLRVRFRAVLTDPVALTFVLLFALASLVVWPGLVGSDGEAWWRLYGSRPGAGLAAIFTITLWLALWPVIPVTYVAGRSTGASRGDVLGVRAVPSLPAGPRTRLLAEVALILGAIALARGFRFLIARGWVPVHYLLDSAMGALVALPLLLAWGAPERSTSLVFTRSQTVVLLLFAAMKLGLLATPWSLTVTCLALSSVLLLLTGREWSVPALTRPRAERASSRVRPALPPALQLRRDFWLEPWRRYGWYVLALVVAQIVLFVLDRTVTMPPFSFFLGSVLVISQVAALALRPLGSTLIAYGLTQRQGVRSGDFARVWAPLPVRREALLRGVYLHGFIVMAAAWAVVVALVALRSYLLTGVLGVYDRAGDSVAALVVPGIALAPSVAGFLVATAAGRRARALLTGLALLAMFYLPILSLVVSSHYFPRGSVMPGRIALGTLIVLALTASLPSLPLLRRPRLRGGNGHSVSDLQVNGR
jgi:hypothetical protein